MAALAPLVFVNPAALSAFMQSGAIILSALAIAAGISQVQQRDQQEVSASISASAAVSLSSQDQDKLALFYHYTNADGYALIKQSGALSSDSWLTPMRLSAADALNVLFIANPMFRFKADYYFLLAILEPAQSLRKVNEMEYRNNYWLKFMSADCILLADGKNAFANMM